MTRPECSAACNDRWTVTRRDPCNGPEGTTRLRRSRSVVHKRGCLGGRMMGRGFVLALLGIVGIGSAFVVTGCGSDATVGNSGGSQETAPNAGPLGGGGTANGGGAGGKNADGTSFCSATGGIALPGQEST